MSDKDKKRIAELEAENAKLRSNLAALEISHGCHKTAEDTE